jgi:phosphotransferase family enzyme
MTARRYKDFPPGWGHIKVPMSSRRAALAGLGLYTASRAKALWAQRAACAAVAILGPGALWGRSFPWIPLDETTWEALAAQWRGAFGAFDDVAGTSRLQASRGGVALLLLRNGAPIAFVKLRQGDDGEIRNEQRALQAMWSYGPRAFRVPEPLCARSFDDWHYLATAPLPSGLHRPPSDPPLPEILEEVAAALADLPRPAGTPDHWRPMHGDFAPWNLRRLRGGSLALVDWERAGWGPPGADEVFYRAAREAVQMRRAGRGAAMEAVQFWRARVAAGPETARDERLARALGVALGRMAQA